MLTKIREQFLANMVILTQDVYTYWMKRKTKVWTINKTALQGYPKNTLGFHLFLFLEKNNIDLMPKHESHDIFHLLCHYGIEPKQESRMQFFLLGNGKISLYLLISLFISAMLFPEDIFVFLQDIQRGRNAQVFYNWDFERMLHEDLNHLNYQIYNSYENVSSPRLSK